MTSSPALRRSAAAMLLAVLLAVRLLSPAGFMPAFDHGSVTIVACPDFDPPAVPMAMSGHHHHDPKKAHQTCPYAAGASAAAIEDFASLAALILAAAGLLAGLAFAFLELHRLRQLPPSRAPPLSA